MTTNGETSGKTIKSTTAGKLRSELTEVERVRLAGRNIDKLFAKLNTELNEIWEDYTAIDFYLLEVHRQVKGNTLARVPIPRLVSKPRMQPISASAIYGIISRIRGNTSGRHAFIDAISLFEQFISTLVFTVYMDFPRKLKGLSSQAEGESGGRQQKLLEIIFESSDRQEMIHKLVEEKVHGIFYGNPLDLFAKDKATIGFGYHFRDNQPILLEAFQEMTARRNVIIHNQSRVDRKYLLEVPNTSLRLGHKVNIDEPYLKRSLLVMKDIAADAAQLVATNVYKQPLRGRARKIQTASKKRPVT